MDDVIDLQGCETCDRENPIERMIMMDDGWICPECYAEWKAEFDACEHEWEPRVSSMGDEGRYCKLCSGFVAEPDNVG